MKRLRGPDGEGAWSPLVAKFSQFAPLSAKDIGLLEALCAPEQYPVVVTAVHTAGPLTVEVAGQTLTQPVEVLKDPTKTPATNNARPKATVATRGNAKCMLVPPSTLP